MNEINLLKIKIQEELWGGVDRIIVVESSCTFSGIEKPLCLTNAIFPSEVVIVQIGKEMQNVPPHANAAVTPFQREAVQRNAALKDIELNDDDVVIATDIDEIVQAEDIPEIVNAVRQCGFIHLLQDRFYYKLNLWSNETWVNGFAVTGRFLKGKTLNQLRNLSGPRLPIRGKHFSFLMSPEAISCKLKSFSHINYATSQYSDPEVIAAKIKNRKDIFNRDVLVKKVKLNLVPVHVDGNFPKSIFWDQATWIPWIEPGKISLEEAKKYIPILDAEFRNDYVSFYNAIDDLKITFPWRKLD